jgi:hypothetical protein
MYAVGETLRDLRGFCGQALTARFFADADAMCRGGAIELPFLLSNPDLTRQCSWILATPNVMAYLEGVPTCEAGDTPSLASGTYPDNQEPDLNGSCMAQTAHAGIDYLTGD